MVSTQIEMEDRGPQTLIHLAVNQFSWRPQHLLFELASLPWAPGYLEIRDKEGMTALAKVAQTLYSIGDAEDLLDAKADVHVMVPGANTGDPERDLLQLCCEGSSTDHHTILRITELFVRHGFPLKEKVGRNPDLYGSVVACSSLESSL